MSLAAQPQATRYLPRLVLAGDLLDRRLGNVRGKPMVGVFDHGLKRLTTIICRMITVNSSTDRTRHANLLFAVSQCRWAG